MFSVVTKDKFVSSNIDFNSMPNDIKSAYEVT